MAIEAFRIALKYMVPVIYPQRRIPGQRLRAVEDPGCRGPPEDRACSYATPAEGDFNPYQRDPETLARPWAIPGQTGLEHRIGGLEKSGQTGDISYDPRNHHEMTLARKGRVDGVVRDIPDLEVTGPRIRRPPRPRLGRHLRRHHAAPPRTPAAVASASPRPTFATSTRSRRTWARCWGATSTCSSPNSTPASFRCSSAASSWSTRLPFNKISGQPFKIAEIEGKIDEVPRAPRAIRHRIRPRALD